MSPRRLETSTFITVPDNSDHMSEEPQFEDSPLSAWIMRSEFHCVQEADGGEGLPAVRSESLHSALTPARGTPSW